MFIIEYLNANTKTWMKFRDLPMFEASDEAAKVAYGYTDKLACKFRIVAENGAIVRYVA